MENQIESAGIIQDGFEEIVHLIPGRMKICWKIHPMMEDASGFRESMIRPAG